MSPSDPKLCRDPHARNTEWKPLFLDAYHQLRNNGLDQRFSTDGSRPGVNFTNVLRAAFTPADPKSGKKLLNLTVFFALSGSASVKAARRTLMKLTPIGRLSPLIRTWERAPPLPPPFARAFVTPPPHSTQPQKFQGHANQFWRVESSRKAVPRTNIEIIWLKNNYIKRPSFVWTANV